MTTHHGPTVLVVEDDRGTREMFDYALRVTGFRVVSAGDGYAALRVIEQDLPDVIVLDLQLPQVSGMDVHQEVTAPPETRRGRPEGGFRFSQKADRIICVD